jgi:dipeptidyl aminopeptidase/acylaminoacyl peptidase
MLIRRGRILIAWVVLLAVVPAVQAQTKRHLTLVDLLNVPSLNDPQLSPDGRQVVYTLAQADWKANRRIAHVWRVQSDGTGTVQLTSGAEGETGPRWSPDGTAIAFVAKRTGSDFAQIHLISNAGGEARALTHHRTPVSRLSWSSDGRDIYFMAADPKPADEETREKAKDDVFAFDENFQQQHLWKVTVATMEETRVTAGEYSVLDYCLSQDGRKIAFHRAPNPLLGYSDRGEVWVMDADGSHALQLTKDDVPENGAVLSPDGSKVLFLAQANARLETYYNRKIFVVSSGGGQARVVSPADMAYEVNRAFWSRDGQSIYFLANMGIRAELFVMPASGGVPRQLTDGKHTVGGWTMVDDRHVFTIDDPTNPGDVWLMTPSQAAPTRVTHVFDYLARDFELAREEAIRWKGADGATVEGLLFYPVGYEPGRRYPLAVQTHGGPQASDKFGFGFWEYYPQGLAARGYAVLQPNYRGSTGYGDAFLRDMVGHYFQNAHLDVMAGVDEVIRIGVADPDCMVKAGWSGGGHMTNKIITFTDRFKAASSGAGAANWISMYAQSDTRTFRTPWFGGTPWQKNAPIDLYWNDSPIKYVANVKTPTLFFVGQQDPRVPMPQAVEMYRALTSNGVPTHLYVAPREPHVWEELRHELFKMNAELEWFEKYATKRPYTWERSPLDSDKEGGPTAQDPARKR